MLYLVKSGPKSRNSYRKSNPGPLITWPRRHKEPIIIGIVRANAHRCSGKVIEVERKVKLIVIYVFGGKKLTMNTSSNTTCHNSNIPLLTYKIKFNILMISAYHVQVPLRNKALIVKSSSSRVGNIYTQTAPRIPGLTR